MVKRLGLEAAPGFEPGNNGFADRRLSHLAMPPQILGEQLLIPQKREGFHLYGGHWAGRILPNALNTDKSPPTCTNRIQQSCHVGFGFAHRRLGHLAMPRRREPCAGGSGRGTLRGPARLGVTPMAANARFDGFYRPRKDLR